MGVQSIQQSEGFLRAAPAAKTRLVRDEILRVFQKKENINGLSIPQLVSATRFSRETVAKHVQALLYENLIYSKNFGNVTIYYSNHLQIRAKDRESINESNRKISINLLDNEFGNFISISERQFQNGDWQGKGSVMVSAKSLNQLIQKLSKVKSRLGSEYS